MTATLKNLGIDKLSLKERVELIHDIWDSVVEENTGSFLTEEQCRELDRRVVEDDADPNAGVPWEQVEREALGRFKR